MTLLLAMVACNTPDPPDTAPEAPRVVAIGPAIAQIVHRLAPEGLVGVDSAGKELTGLAELPAVGFSRNVSAEGVLSLGPTLVIASDRAGPPEALAQIEAAGIPLIRLHHERSLDGVRELVRGVAGAIKQDSVALIASFDASCSPLTKPDPAPRALFIYARGGGMVNVSGTDTAAAAMMRIAGLENVVTAYDGYKPLTPEAAVDAAPDVVVFTTRGLEIAGGVGGVKTMPGLGLLEAVKNGRVVAVDDLQLLALGLDTCTGAIALAAQAAP